MPDTKTLALGNGVLTPRLRYELDVATGSLTYKAIEVEVQRARAKPLEALDVRELSFRAIVDWNIKKDAQDEKGAYTTATRLLNRALTIAPDDPLALRVTATVNLCDCVVRRRDWYWRGRVDHEQIPPTSCGYSAQVASRESVEQAVSRRAAAKDLASDLNVHFLIRGRVTPATPQRITHARRGDRLPVRVER